MRASGDGGECLKQGICSWFHLEKCPSAVLNLKQLSVDKVGVLCCEEEGGRLRSVSLIGYMPEEMCLKVGTAISHEWTPKGIRPEPCRKQTGQWHSC